MESIFVRNSKPVKKNLPRVKFGIPGLDKILGGGLVLGTVTLIEEDCISKNFISLYRCFLGEGAANKEKLFIYSDKNPENIIPIIGKPPKQNNEKLRIA